MGKVRSNEDQVKESIVSILSICPLVTQSQYPPFHLAQPAQSAQAVSTGKSINLAQ